MKKIFLTIVLIMSVLCSWAQNAQDAVDLKCKQVMLEYMEADRQAFERKDISFLEMRFHPQDQDPLREEVMNLFERLNNKTKISLSYQDINFYRHPTLYGWYSVKLAMNLRATSEGETIYLFDGYCSILWDFTDEDHPVIHDIIWRDKDDVESVIDDLLDLPIR